MDTANYLRNRLPTKFQLGEIIPEEEWTGQVQDLQHLWIFGILASVGIPPMLKERAEKTHQETGKTKR